MITRIFHYDQFAVCVVELSSQSPNGIGGFASHVTALSDGCYYGTILTDRACRQGDPGYCDFMTWIIDRAREDGYMTPGKMVQVPDSIKATYFSHGRRGQ